jgi:hypothetical protein
LPTFRSAAFICKVYGAVVATVALRRLAHAPKFLKKRYDAVAGDPPEWLGIGEHAGQREALASPSDRKLMISSKEKLVVLCSGDEQSLIH